MFNKITCLTYYGASIMAGNHGGIGGWQNLVTEKYPEVLLAQCYSHILNVVLVSYVMEYGTFCATFLGTILFLSPARVNALSSFMNNKLLKLVPMKWKFVIAF